jgi:hypothetical protein
VSDQRRGQDEHDHAKELNVRKIWLFTASSGVVIDEEFGKVHEYREKALDGGDLIATSTRTMAG